MSPQADRIAKRVQMEEPLRNPVEIEAWLTELRRTLIVMKAARAHLALSLSRTRAAGEFIASVCRSGTQHPDSTLRMEL